MRKSIGYGAYSGFGYADEPQWGLFNPAQSLFSSDPTLYSSLYATNHDAEDGVDQARYNPGLPREVGPRKAWARSNVSSLYAPIGTNSTKGMTEKNNLDGYGEESSAGTAKVITPIFLLIAAIVLIKLFKVGG